MVACIYMHARSVLLHFRPVSFPLPPLWLPTCLAILSVCLSACSPVFLSDDFADGLPACYNRTDELTICRTFLPDCLSDQTYSPVVSSWRCYVCWELVVCVPLPAAFFHLIISTLYNSELLETETGHNVERIDKLNSVQFTVNAA